MPGGSGVHAGRVKWAVAEAPPSAVHPHPWAAPETYGLLDRRVTSTTPPGKTKWALPCYQTVREGQMGCLPCYQTGNLLSFFPPDEGRVLLRPPAPARGRAAWCGPIFFLGFFPGFVPHPLKFMDICRFNGFP